MLYGIVKIWSTLGFWLFSKHVRIIHPERLHTQGPLLLAVNHPNSFLDAVLLGTFMKQPVHFITRGDVFKHALPRKIFESLHMIPIFRIRDGKDKLSLNDETFQKGVAVLRKGGLLLIFVEGFCENQTTLQLPLKKGGPRMLQACWQQGVDARVLPIWLEYSSFNKVGKTIDMRLGEPFGKELTADVHSAKALVDINHETARQLQQLHASTQQVHHKASGIAYWLLALPAALGWLLHAPLYLPVKAVAHALNQNVHFDSLNYVLLLFTYPIYLMAVSALVFFFTHNLLLALAVWVALPLLAKAQVLYKN